MKLSVKKFAALCDVMSLRHRPGTLEGLTQWPNKELNQRLVLANSIA